jgi:hypothetical protein
MKEIRADGQDGLMEENPFYPEFNKKDATNMSLRKERSFSDEFVIRRCRIYKNMGPTDNRLQVQPIPEFQGMDDAEMDALPKYPMFFAGTNVTGKCVKDDGDKAEDVWCICTADFQIGYVLGKANIFYESNKKYPFSYNYAEVKKFLTARQALPSDFDYNHVDVVHFVNSDKGGMVELFNYLTGDWVLLNSSGSILTVQQQRIYARVGTPPNPVTAGPVAFTAMTLTADRFHVKSPNIDLEGEKVILAKHNLQVAGITPGVPACGTNGVNLIPIENVYI